MYCICVGYFHYTGSLLQKSDKSEVHHGGLRLLRIPTNLFGLPTKYKDEMSNCHVTT